MSQAVEDVADRQTSHPSRAGACKPSTLARALSGTALAVMLASSVPAHAQLSAETQRHLTASVKNAGGDVEVYNNWRTYACSEVEDPNVFDRWSAERRRFRIPLVQLFDDLWYVGDMYVGQYILKTPTGGFILIDALNNTADIDNYTMPALRALGLGPSNPLLALLLTHGHGDHDGGAARLRALFPNLEIYLGSGDANNKSYGPIRIDSTDPAPQERIIGGVPIVFQSAPGHTPGSTFYVVPVHQDGKEYKLMQGGRNGAPGNANSARQFVTAMERGWQLAKQYGVVGTFHVHTNSDGSITSIQQIQRDGRRPNPFIIGNERTMRAMASLRECAAAWLATRDATAVVPTWRVTSLTLSELKPQTKTLTAQLTSGWGSTDPAANATTPDAQWGPVAGQLVVFDVERSGAACTAVTDSQGVASCTLERKLLPTQRVTATFGGNTTETYVNLPSSKSSVVPFDR